MLGIYISYTYRHQNIQFSLHMSVQAKQLLITLKTRQLCTGGPLTGYKVVFFLILIMR